jgi:DNA-binding XRE family transcriptional regulator
MGPIGKATQNGLAMAGKRGVAYHCLLCGTFHSPHATQEKLMPVRRYTKDPRTEAQRDADEQVFGLVESGEFLRVKASTERMAVEAVARGQEERRWLAASLGVRLGLLRRAHGLTQQDLARVLGTRKSNISRLERGRDRGLTVERLIAVEDAIRSLAGGVSGAARGEGLIRFQQLDRFRTASDCLETA